MNFSVLSKLLLLPIISPFRTERGISKRLLLIFVCINGLVLLNAVLHAPSANYDGFEHDRYIETLAKEKHLPNLEDSKEFFSPPLPYLLPAAILGTESSSIWAAAKMGQLLNVVLSLGVTLTLLKICHLLAPEDEELKVLSLAILGIMPVYYKTFALVRGEPFVTFFAVLAVYVTLRIFFRVPENISIPMHQRNMLIVGLGICLGFIILSRQWGFFLFPALVVFVILLKRKTTWTVWRTQIILLIASFFIAFAVGGWFYISLFGRYGSITAFNRPPKSAFTFSNQPIEFYTGLGLNNLFTNPVRDAFANQFIPVFYSEFWGDYWGYFIVTGRDTRSNDLLVGSVQQFSSKPGRYPDWYITNKSEVTPYLGRVNLVSLLPSTLMLGGFGLGFLSLIRFIRQNPTPQLTGNMLLALILLATMAGYFWFLIRYPNLDKGDTIKASYMLHLYPFVAILAGQVLQKIRALSSLAGQIIIALLFFVFIHNLPAMITRFIPWDLLAYYPPFRWVIGYLPWH